MPADIGPWDTRSAIRTRQILLHALLREMQRIHLIIPQKSCEEYWETGHYETYTLPRELVVQHFQNLHDLLLKFPEKITLELIPQQEPFPVDMEVINGEWVFFQQPETTGEQGGTVFYDQEFAQKLMTYIDHNISSKCPAQRKDSGNVAKWIQKKFSL